MKTENRILLACLRAFIRPETGKGLPALLDGTTNWDYLQKIAQRHRVLALLQRALREHCPGSVPAGILKRLDASRLSISLHNLRLTGKLLDLLSLFELHGLPAFPFKGAVLASSAYGDLGLRQFADLDIILRRQDVLKAGKLLQARGYKPFLELPPGQQALFLKTGCELSFTHPDDNVPVELHWDFTPVIFSPAFSAESLWNHLEWIEVSGKKIRGLSAEDTILALCVHGAKHLWCRLQWICDIAMLTSARVQPDWNALMKKAECSGNTRLLNISLRLAHELFEPAWAPEVLAKILKDRGAERLASKISRRLFLETYSESDASRESSYFQFLMHERLRDKYRHGLGLLLKRFAPRNFAKGGRTCIGHSA